MGIYHENEKGQDESSPSQTDDIDRRRGEENPIPPTKHVGPDRIQFRRRRRRSDMARHHQTRKHAGDENRDGTDADGPVSQRR